MKPVVALVGRPNVGKSTLFNRITKSRQALVDDMPGVTRDRQYADTQWEDKAFTLVDTGGFLSVDDDYFAAQIKAQLLRAVEQADVLVFILDGRTGLSPYDRDLADLLRRTEKPVFYLINKVESLYSQENELGEFYSLGVDRLYKISAEHGLGVGDFLSDLVAMLPDAPAESGEQEEDDDNGPIRIAIIGRPNVGKSSLANRLFGEQRVVVNDKAGTTRDAIELSVNRNGREFILKDTAGIRRKGKVLDKLEKFSILKALDSMDGCDVALILIDCSEGITDQDITIAGYAEKRGCGAIFLLNKWDLVDKSEKGQQAFIKELRQKAKFLAFAPAVTISAKTGQRCHKIFGEVEKVYKQYCHRINTGMVNRIIEDAVYRDEPSLHKGRRLKFFYAAQVAVKPPTFVCFVNYPDAVHFSYKRYLVNQLRQMIPLNLTPVKLYFREKTGKIEFSGNTKEFRRIQEKKKKVMTKRDKQRKEQSRKKRERDHKNVL
ncbi:ribosome biogenesis GTPase Der [Desulfobacter hydrogenophilus]|uniref:GTPase Der n=1 Tax=Desulfobacter hydrogenophilus TaxID=2291 RepID=A0A328FJN3_9BACT|nr:ribosome biogenesis GTPase Der [Desulfobacter hydrogenophilus]NDY72801.1 ribosome biogenesis GTPase Der [Desulfobacter hydrogenophilus]QBH13027.1 ribosome biogenesis GTPase Der [Desulfobacter hydrogenophilus]RAM04010.1 ribosome biogenesis GTPase Der [Desulfobacter hydrogenophilus]